MDQSYDASQQDGVGELSLQSWLVNFISIPPIALLALCHTLLCQANVEITSRYSGKVTKIHYAEGDIAAVGLPLVDFDVEGVADAPAHDAPATNAEDNKTPAPEPEPAPEPVQVPTPVAPPPPRATTVPLPSTSNQASSPGTGKILTTPV